MWRLVLPVFAAALWWGSLTSLGAWVVPLLFKHLEPTALAGQMAARLFEFQTHASVVCALVLLMSARQRAQFAVLGWVLGGMLLALLQQWVVAPRIEARIDMALWHSVGTALWLAQWVCASVCLWKFARTDPSGSGISPERAS